jgi:Fic family protein
MGQEMEYDNKLEDCYRLRNEIEQYRPLDPHTIHELKRYYRIGFTYTSNALEGNTLTESETKVVLEDGLTIGGKPMKDHLEAIGHAKAYDYLYELVDQADIKEKDILALHRLVVEGIEGVELGRYRSKPVIITGTDFIPPKPIDVAERMNIFLSEKFSAWQKEKDPVEQAALSHLELVTIHPFMDGNGRTARLLMNLLLLKAGFGITIIPPIVRNDYVSTLRIAQVEQNPQTFLNFISHQVYESMKDLLRLIRALQN